MYKDKEMDMSEEKLMKDIEKASLEKSDMEKYPFKVNGKYLD